MEWSTHALSGVVAGYVLTGGDYKGALVGGVAGVISDLDEPKSKFGKVFFPISYPLHALFGHRTFTHSLLFVLLLGVITFIFFDSWVYLGVMGGVLAHILGDMMTGKIKLLYPLQHSIGIAILPSTFILIDGLARVILIIFIIKITWTDFISGTIQQFTGG